jgi:aerobic carbon-monoxide dehydrogenase medium subunit
MISQEFEFHAPSTVAEAVELLAANAEDGKVLAGGMSLVPAMNLGIARPTAVISLNRVSELDYVRDDGDVLRIGAMTRHVRIETDPVIAGAFPLLGRAASVIGDVQVRNRGTIGGSVAHADPAADYLPVMLALGASFKVASSSGERTIAARDFFQGVMATALEPHELLVEIELRKLPAGTGTSYLRLARLEGSFPLANAAAVVDGGPAVVAVGGTTAAPFLVEVESPEALDAVEDAACEAAVSAFDDLAATAEYRRAMAGLYARRAVEAALANRRGG